MTAWESWSLLQHFGWVSFCCGRATVIDWACHCPSCHVPAMGNGDIPPNVIDQVQGIIDDAKAGKIPLITAYEDICDVLYENSLLKDRVLRPDEVLVHPSNRGKSGLNAYDAHKNGAAVAHVGVDPKEMKKVRGLRTQPPRTLAFGAVALQSTLGREGKWHVEQDTRYGDGCVGVHEPLGWLVPSC